MGGLQALDPAIRNAVGHSDHRATEALQISRSAARAGIKPAPPRRPKKHDGAEFGGRCAAPPPFRMIARSEHSRSKIIAGDSSSNPWTGGLYARPWSSEACAVMIRRAKTTNASIVGPRRWLRY